MVKTKNFSIKSLILTSMCALMGLFFIVPSATTANISRAETNNYSYRSANTTNFSVTAYKLDGTQVTTTSSGATANRIEKANWKDVKYFTLSLQNLSTLATPTSYTYSVVWTPYDCSNLSVYPTSGNASSKEEVIRTANVSSVAGIPSEIRFYVDDLPETPIGNYVSGNSVLGADYMANGGWGLYQFSFDINGDSREGISYATYLAPTDIADIDGAPVFEKEARSSTKSMNSAYKFTITSPDYKFVRRDSIKWYVSGESSSNKRYVLLQEDIPATTTYSSIFPNNDYNRTGLTFLFDFGISGKWDISCKAFSMADESVEKESSVTTISTIKVMPKTTIIAIVVGCIAGAAVLLTVIIIVTKKRERIW